MPAPPHRSRARLGKRSFGLLTLAVSLLVAVGTTVVPHAPATAASAAAGVAGPSRATSAGLYLVTLAGLPAAAHPSTRPEPGARYDRTRAAVLRHQARLVERQDRVLGDVGGPEVLYRFTTALNGFAAELDPAQVKELRSRPDVLLVERSTTRRTASDSTDFLDLDGANGAWSRSGGARDAGRGVVVGLVDSGIWPDNPSFAGRPQVQPGRATGLPGFHGACAAAERWSPSDCNAKIVSARWFVRGFGVGNLATTEPVSARDAVGHGSHAASTVAGDRDVRVDIDGQAFGRDTGVVPAARLAVYKACWTAPDPADDGCTTADSVAAVDQAVADGVDVIGFAVSGSDDPGDTLSRAFLSASAAGVFVAAAAGNDGPVERSVGHAAPWVTTVGASTSHAYQGAVRLPDGTAYVGAMSTDRSVPESPVVLAADAAAPGADAQEAGRCEPGSLDARAVQDTVVVCDRGVVPRVDKSAAVAGAGGVGMVLVNTAPDTVDADVHVVPTVHLDVEDGSTLAAYVGSAGPAARVSLDAGASEDVPVPGQARFSAHGPVAGGDLLKPDVTAPGVAVVGAVAPPTSSGRLWDLMSGTSVSTSHVAGLAALILGVHPTWSPARVKSAMMTTAYDLAGDADPLAQGAGHVDPSRFLDPGVVLDARPAAWRAFLRGERRPHDLNLASISIGSLVGRTTVVRRLTNVGETTETYTGSVSGLGGVSARLRPAGLTLSPGESRRVRIRLVATPDAPLGTFSTGAITWTGLSHQARIPVVVRTSAVAVPGEVAADGSAGTLRVSGHSGRGTPVGAVATGLVPANPVGVTLQPGPFDVAFPEVDADTFATDVSVPADSEAARFEVSARNGGDDVDLYVFRDDRVVGAAAGGAADATVTLDAPDAGDYRVYVHAAAAGNGSTSTAQFTSWVVSRDGGTPLTLTPGTSPSRAGSPFDYTLSWEDLDPTKRWLAVVRYTGSDRRTLVRIN